MNKKEHYLISVICFLSGIIIGFLIAPAKQGFGNNNINNYYYKKDEENKTEDNNDEETDEDENSKEDSDKIIRFT